MDSGSGHVQALFVAREHHSVSKAFNFWVQPGLFGTGIAEGLEQACGNHLPYQTGDRRQGMWPVVTLIPQFGGQWKLETGTLSLGVQAMCRDCLALAVQENPGWVLIKGGDSGT